MQKTVYICNNCNRTIGEKKHISLSFSNSSGIAVPPKDSGRADHGWAIQNSLQGRFMHFCNPKCISDFFSVLMIGQLKSKAKK